LNVVQKYGCHKIIAQSVIASILQWNRTKLIDDNKMTMILSTLNSDSKILIYILETSIISTSYIFIFLAAISRSCTEIHNLFSFLSSDSFLMTSYSLIK